jgi:hypothetical protein
VELEVVEQQTYLQEAALAVAVVLLADLLEALVGYLVAAAAAVATQIVVLLVLAVLARLAV